MVIQISRAVSRTFASLVHRIGHSILPRPGVVFHHVHSDVQVGLAVPQVEVAPRLSTAVLSMLAGDCARNRREFEERFREISAQNRGWLRAGSVCLGSTYAPYSAGDGPSSARRMCQSRSVLKPLVSPAHRRTAGRQSLLVSLTGPASRLTDWVALCASGGCSCSRERSVGVEGQRSRVYLAAQLTSPMHDRTCTERKPARKILHLRAQF